jgi:hypothetical protein
LLLNAELEIAEDPSLIEAAYADFLVAFMLEKSDGSETLVHHSFCKSCVGLPEASVAS